jgi:hypothetical protein
MTDETKGGAIVEHGGGRGLARSEAREVGLPMEQRMAMLREALTNPDVNPEKAVVMADLMFRMEDRDREATFIAAKTAAIAEMPRIGQDGFNTHLKSRYAKWETMQPIVNRVLTRHGLALSFVVGGDAGKLTVRPVLQGHGWTEQGEAMPLPMDKGPGRSDVQAVGSSISYGKRYAAMAMLNILQAGVAEDDDGAGGSTDPYDALNLGERELVDQGRREAAEGTEHYAAWFKTLATDQRGFLAYNKGVNGVSWHDQNKALAEKV